METHNLVVSNYNLVLKNCVTGNVEIRRICFLMQLNINIVVRNVEIGKVYYLMQFFF